MRIPVMNGIIDRRILANFRIDRDVMAKNLPSPFRPKLVGDYAIGGICLIRLKSVRPRFVPAFCGIHSENAAHRIAVEWDENGGTREGVYIPRRDTSSLLNSLAGGAVFPGVHHRAKFTIRETEDYFSVSLQSIDQDTHVHVSGTIADSIPETSVFPSLSVASQFFENGSLGYSKTTKEGFFDGLELRCRNWNVQALAVEKVVSSYFQNEDFFPPGSVAFDCALLMRNIDHEWHGREDLCCSSKTN